LFDFLVSPSPIRRSNRAIRPGPVRFTRCGARVAVATASSPKKRRHSPSAESLAAIFFSLTVLQRRRVRFSVGCARVCLSRTPAPRRHLPSCSSYARVPSAAVGVPAFARRRAAPHRVSAPSASICVSPEQCCCGSCAAATLRIVFSVCTGSAPPGRVHVFLSSPRHTVGRAVSSASSLQSSLIRGSITEAGPVFVLGWSRLDLRFSSTRAERC
jgi:hypothetical protein